MQCSGARCHPDGTTEQRRSIDAHGFYGCSALSTHVTRSEYRFQREPGKIRTIIVCLDSCLCEMITCRHLLFTRQQHIKIQNSSIDSLDCPERMGYLGQGGSRWKEGHISSEHQSCGNKTSTSQPRSRYSIVKNRMNVEMLVIENLYAVWAQRSAVWDYFVSRKSMAQNTVFYLFSPSDHSSQNVPRKLRSGSTNWHSSSRT